jgi:hypothetical protein
LVYTPVPAAGAPVTILLGTTTIKSGNADGDGVFCFRPCTAGSYTVKLGAQGNCVDNGAGFSWSVGACGAQPISTTQPGPPGYTCCNGILVPSQFLVTDANGSWVNGNANATSVPHAADLTQTELLGRVQFISNNSPASCIFGLYGDGNPCINADTSWGLIMKTVLVSNPGPLSYGYYIFCGVDEEGGVYIECDFGYGFGLASTTEYSYSGHLCCIKNGVMVQPPGLFADGTSCVDYPDLGTPYTWEIDPYLGYCVVVDPDPIPSGPCKCVAFYNYGGGAGPYGESVIPTPNRVYIGRRGDCTKVDGPFSFSFAPGPVSSPGGPGYPPPIWAFESDVDCPYPTLIAPIDHGICPPPPGGATITVSGYFP